MYVKYAVGGFTLGYQESESDHDTASSSLDSTAYGITYAVNDDLSISYGESETEAETSSTDQEIEGMSIAYSMGSMSIAAHSNEGTNLSNTAARESTHTEISLNFAF